MRKSRLLLLILLLPLTCLATELTPDEVTVWQLEEAYWQYAKTNDVEAYRTLWDERFIGWGSDAEHPIGKQNVGSWIPGLHENPERVYDYRLQQEAVRAFGDTVATHYLQWDEWRDAKTGAIVEESPPYRMTHTWQRHGDTWQIITGMAATYDH